MIDAFLSCFQWYRRFKGGSWIEIRIDLGDRPVFWIRPEDRAGYPKNTVVDREDW